MDDRATVSRYQGSTLRHGFIIDAHRRADEPRPSALGQRFRDCLTDAAGHGGRKPRHGPSVEIQHQQATHSLAVPAGLHALRTDPNHARASARTADGQIRRGRDRFGALSKRYGGVKMRGWLRAPEPIEW